MKNKILFIGSLNTKQQKYDGERIKSTIMYDCLCKVTNVKLINLSKRKFLNSLRIFLHGSLFRRNYKKIIISKDPHGANIIVKILRFSRCPMDRIIYFEIGPFLYDRILAGNINRDVFIGFEIVVETESMKKELGSLGFKQLDVFPNFKPIPNIPFVEQEYPKRTMRLIYFSRINEMKGIYDLIDAVNQLNRQYRRFELDIYGRLESDDDEKRISSLCNNGISYRGKMDLTTPNEYDKLSAYDLFVFPTKYSEGFPGAIIDFFIAGVPILSSTFSRAEDILSNEESYFFEKGNVDDLKRVLEEIYNSQNLLSVKRKNSYLRRMDFSVERFLKYISHKI